MYLPFWSNRWKRMRRGLYGEKEPRAAQAAIQWGKQIKLAMCMVSSNPDEGLFFWCLVLGPRQLCVFCPTARGMVVSKKLILRTYISVQHLPR